jgi:hypothetical protein
MWFKYWKNENKSDLYYLFKVVHNKSMYEEKEFNKGEYNDKKENTFIGNLKIIDKKQFNKFCSFVFKLNDKKNINKIEGLADPHLKEDDIFYIYYFLKDYDSIDLFKNLTFFGLKKYLLNC